MQLTIPPDMMEESWTTTDAGHSISEQHQNGLSVRSDTRVHAEEFPLLRPNVTLTTHAPDPGNQPRHQSSLLGDAERENLRDMYTAQTAVLLSVACLGAFILLSINLVGVLFFKGYFRKKAKPMAPPCMHLQSLSHTRRCRYSTLLRRFSLQTHSLPEPLTTSSDSHSYEHSAGYEPEYVAPSRARAAYACNQGVHGNGDCLYVTSYAPAKARAVLFMERERGHYQETDLSGREWRKKKCKCATKKSDKKDRSISRRRCKHKRSRSLEDLYWLRSTAYTSRSVGINIV